MKLARFEVFSRAVGRSPSGRWWYWRLVAPNGRKVAAGGEAFSRAASAVASIRSLARMLGAPMPRVRIVREGRNT